MGKRRNTATPLTTAAAGARPLGWIDTLAPWLIRHAARNGPRVVSERLEEEWLAELPEQQGQIGRLQFALGCCWAAVMIRRDPRILAVAAPGTGEQTMMAHAHIGASLFPRSRMSTPQGTVVCDINITPLIDVMLVLLITLVVSLPIMTHAVKIDLPQTPPSQDIKHPDVIDVDVEFDGTIVWNNRTPVSLQQLESYFQTEARRELQPEIHLRADRHVKYEIVAKVLASAQHNRMQRIGFVNTAEFNQ